MNSLAADRQREPTPFVDVTTDAPFPHIELPKDLNDAEVHSVKEKAHATEKVVLSYCSELSTYSAPITLFDTKHKTRLFHDAAAQPLVFTIGTDERLYCLVHVAELRESWEAVDVTPNSEETKVIMFDALEVGGIIHLAAVVLEHDRSHVIYYAMLEKPKLSTEHRILKGLDAKTLDWQKIRNNLGSKAITTITCIQSESFYIAVGTSQVSNQFASHYIVDVKHKSEPWRDVPMPAKAERILALSGAHVPNTKGDALVTLFEDDAKARRVVIPVIHDRREIQHTYRLLPGSVGEPQDIFVSHSPLGGSDVIVAGKSGIGFYSFDQISEAPKSIKRLAGISFKQVCCTEYAGTELRFSTLNILAISETGDLYFIEGKRWYNNKRIEFESSGLPIRSDIQHITARFNGLLDSSEVCYVGTGSNEIGHLFRSRESGSWSSNKISVIAEDKTIQYKAYITAIQLKSTSGTVVPPNYPINIASSTPTLVTINGLARCVKAKPTVIKTDAAGKILIVTQATDLVTAPAFTVSLPKYSTIAKLPEYTLETSQRIIYQLRSKPPGEEELKGFRDASGALHFDAQSDFSNAASIMSSFKGMSEVIEGNPDGAVNFQRSWEISGDGTVKPSNTDWLSKTMDDAGKFLGDAVEFLKRAVKGTVKLGIIAAKGAVKLLIEIGGEPLEFFLDTVGALVTGVLTAVASLLGSATQGLLDFFGLTPDPKFAKETREALSDLFGALLLKVELFIETNESTLELAVEKLTAKMRTVIDDTRPKVEADDRKAADSPLMKLINNPIIQALLKFNPVQWILEAIQEETEIDLKVELPDFDPILSIIMDALPELFSNELETFGRLYSDIQNKFADVMKDKNKMLDILLNVAGSTFWTVFDILKHMVFAFYKVSGALVKQLKIIAEFPMKIPYFSNLFEDTTGLEFSFKNFASHTLAYILCLGNKSNPADRLRPLAEFVSAITAQDLDIKEKLGWNPSASEFEAEARHQAQLQRSARLNLTGKVATDNPAFRLMSSGEDWKNLEHFGQCCTALVSATRTFLIVIEAVIPFNDATHEVNMRDWRESENRRHRPRLPLHGINEDKREKLHNISLIFSGFNFIGHVGNLVVASIHPHSDCARLGWCAGSVVFSLTALVIDKVPAANERRFADIKPALVSVISTTASLCQLVSEDELPASMKGLHFAGCGAGALLALAIGLRKKLPEVAIALGGLSGLGDVSITMITGYEDFLHPHHGSVHEADKRAKKEKQDESDKLLYQGS